MRKFILLLLSVLWICGNTTGQRLYSTGPHLWRAQKDEVYLQESAEKIKSEQPVVAVAIIDNQCFGVTSGNLFQIENGNYTKVNNAPTGILRLKHLNGQLWALTNNGIFLRNGTIWSKIDNRQFVDLCLHQGFVHGATTDEVYRLEEGRFVSIQPKGGYYSSDMTMLQEDGSQINDTPVSMGPITRIQSHNGTLYVLRPGELILFDGKIVNRDFVDWGRLPSKQTHDLLSLGSRLFVSTDKGLSVLRGSSLSTIGGQEGLPVEQTSCLTEGFAGDLWIGTSHGAVRMVSEDEWHYFGAQIWLPGDHVNDIAVDKNRVIVATDAGIGIMHYEPFTLLKKASFYERHIEEWGHKRLGFVHNLYLKNGEWVREVSDNDGGNTAPYLAAMCYKYACTGDVTARKEAVNSAMALIWLDRITPVDGFIARSIWSATADRDERGKQGSGGLPARWYPTKDGKWFWKGDTSSDEVIAHFYAISLFYELAAEGKEKELAKEHIRRMASYIIDCGFAMNDLDGKPTRWARWNPEYLLRPYGYSDKGLNGLEVLTFMETANAITKDEKFKLGNQQLIKWGYPQNTIRQKNVFPPETIAPWDDHLAFWSYYTLLRYVGDPQLKALYLRSLDRTWEVKRMAQVPWYNFIYGVATGNDCDENKVVKHLREFPLDCVANNYSNSHRDDLTVERGYTSYEGGKKNLSPRESSIAQDNHSSTDLDGGLNGRRVMIPTGFLLDYWMGRYHGFIEAPLTSDPDLVGVKSHSGQHFGAAPYDGPARPEF
jgi:hypothetical protein